MIPPALWKARPTVSLRPWKWWIMRWHKAVTFFQTGGLGRILEVVGFKIESVTLIKVCRYTCLVVHMYYNLDLMCLFFDNCKYDVYIYILYVYLLS